MSKLCCTNHNRLPSQFVSLAWYKSRRVDLWPIWACVGYDKRSRDGYDQHGLVMVAVGFANQTWSLSLSLNLLVELVGGFVVGGCFGATPQQWSRSDLVVDFAWFFYDLWICSCIGCGFCFIFCSLWICSYVCDCDSPTLVWKETWSSHNKKNVDIAIYLVF